MAKLYGEIAAKALLTLDKSFARANGQPLDASEVYYSKAAAEEYAATAQAYIGQKIVVIENGVVTHYSVEDTAGTLKELGSKPVADGTTVAIGADGKITLANIAEANKTGTYNAVLVNGVLTWVKPSETTVEGLSDLIQALTGRVDTAEADIDALQASVGVASKAAVGEEGSEDYEPAVVATGLHKAVEDEVARAKAAEQALGERIDGIDFVDTDELASALEPYAKTADIPVTGVAADDKVLSLTDKLVAATISLGYDENNKAIKLYGKDNAELGSVDATPFIKDGMLHDVDYDTESNTLTFIWNTDAGESKTDTVVLSDIIEPYTAGDGLELVGNEFKAKLADGSEGFLTITADGIKLAGIANAIATAAATAKSEAIADAEGKIATAKQEVIDDAASKYATKEYVGNIPDNYTETNVISYINKKAEETLAAAQGGSSETAASVKQQLDNYKSENDTKVNANTTAITTINEKLTTIEENADVNIIETVKVNGAALTPDENKAVDITVPTKFTDITDDSGFDARITAAQTQADKGVSDAAGALAAANAAQETADSNKTQLDTNTGKITNLETTTGDHTTRITNLESADQTHAAEYTALKGIVDGHTETIAKKADTTTVDVVSAKASANEAAIQTINETTIPGVKAEVAKKANAADVYTKTEVDNKLGNTGDKTIIELINEAKTEVTYDDTQIKADIKANTDALAILNSTAETVGSVANTAAAAAKAEVATVVGAAPEAMDTLEEVAKWIENDESGAAAMANRITANETAIAAINNTTTGILAEAKSYTNKQILAIAVASKDEFGLAKVDDVSIQATAGIISVKAVSTDLLTQGTSELILNGGSAV